jgi:hypothetical protein
MDIKALKEKLLEDVENIKKILENIGCDRIAPHKNEYRCAKDKKDLNSTRVVVKFDEYLTARIYDLVPVKGDILVIIMELKKCTLSEAIKTCCEVIGVTYEYKSTQKPKTRRNAFNGFYSSIKKEHTYKININRYEDDILKEYRNKGSIRFKKDNIDYDVQTDFDIMYDYETNRIVVPWRDENGYIIGIMGRYNDSTEYCEINNISKWLPLPTLSFPKSQFLYGLYQNYKYILQCGIVYIGESEKFVLQCRSFGVFNTVSIGSHDISDRQRELLLSLGVDIVTCMDEGIPDEFNAEQCKFLKSKSHLVGGRVGFAMVDEILNSKESPSDRGIEIWNQCIAEDNIFWV